MNISSIFRIGLALLFSVGISISSPIAMARVDPPTVSINAIKKWPTKGRVEYRALYGDGQIFAGNAVHTWEHNATQYTLKLDLASAGFVRLLTNFDLTWLAEGQLEKNRFISQRFNDVRNKKTCESRIDYEAGKITQIRRGEQRELELSGPTLDVLSLMHFVSLHEPAQQKYNLSLNGACWLSASEVNLVGTEKIQLPIGEVETLHYRSVQSKGELQVDFWLAKAKQNAPVRIQIDDQRNKHRFDLQAEKVEIATSAGQ